MWLADPVFLRKSPSVRTQLILLLMLAWVSLPLLFELPLSVCAAFALLWIARVALLFTSIKKLPLWALIILLVATSVWVYFRVGTIIGRDASVSLLMLMIILKAFEGETLRDWQILLLAQLVLMGGGLLFNQSILMAPWLIVALFCLISSLGLLAGIKPMMAIRQGAVILILSFPLAVILFIAMPRRNTPLWGVPQPQQSSVTGLSDTLESGSVSNLILSNELAFNVIFDNNAIPRNADMYWRVMVMGNNTDGKWHAVKEQYTDEDTLQLPSRALLEQRNDSKMVGYELIIQDDHGRLPALDQPLPNEQFGFSRRVGNVVRVNNSREGLRRVHLYSQMTPYLRQQMDQGLLNYYTQLPDGLNPETRRLAKQLADKSGGSEEFINHILTYFKSSHFQYTLTPKRNNETQNKIDYFLFEGHEGFCEDYADAMVWLARSIGVPARIVIGYQGGEYHPDNKFWQIRSKDAHAWTEIWIAEKGLWKRVDPTTAVSSVRIDKGVESALPAEQRAGLSSAFPLLQKYLDNGQFYWQQWVVNYDRGSQKSILSWLNLKNIPVYVLIIVIIIAIVITSLPLIFWLRRQGNVQTQPLTDGINLLKQTIVEGEESELSAIGPLELQNILAEHNLLNEDLAALLTQYIDWQYGAAGMPDMRSQRKWLRKMKKAVRNL
ncbi:Transglutaminase-like enzyme, putative cysteine protease [Snodgrassella alvi SCGC AB-598-J21]|uniref:Transglutaminase-like enzyme, putative cysteine protease n=2 Tax=Snodgrassella alvi TaxID=1196083 RepID=A0A074V791_9NEIS|nr:Transglutaminase-like enzyme, putative cysteine protease [Snodgrassella alvi SCGC AB-598-J21]